MSSLSVRFYVFSLDLGIFRAWVLDGLTGKAKKGRRGRPFSNPKKAFSG